MRITPPPIPGSVLPTVVVVSVVILTAMAGLLMLWEHEQLFFARSCRLRQARADIESAYTLYCLHPEDRKLASSAGFQLYDSLPGSRIILTAQPWGLYEAVGVRTCDSLVRTCRLFGAQTEAVRTLYYADNRAAVTLAGKTVLHGALRLPQNGLVYGRVGGDFYQGEQIAHTAIKRSEQPLPAPQPTALSRIRELFVNEATALQTELSDSLTHSFQQNAVHCIRLGNAELGDCVLRGKMLLCADELRIDSTCRIEHLLVVARKITIGCGAHITAQLFARDTVIVEARAVLDYPSGIYTEAYAKIGSHARVDGYVIVRDTVSRKKFTPNYHQSRTARLRGMLYVDGVAQVQGLVCGQAVIRQAAYFSSHGYYKDMLYGITLLENPVTTYPLWLPAERRKEVVCVD